MVSRDTLVHLVAVLHAFAAWVLAVAILPSRVLEDWNIVFLLVFQGIAFGGAHLYLAVRGDDGMVPVAARWRYVGMLGLVLAAVGLPFYAGDQTVGNIELAWHGRVFVVLTVVVYLVVEGVESYRDARPE
ncbi:hypothetical protein ACKVMT_15655 [Halobacteriales archaeon Cl-PHB]